MRDARRPALRPDALLLGRRFRDRSPVGAVAGATLVIEAQPEPERTLALLQRERVDVVPWLARPGRGARGASCVRRPPTCRRCARAACKRSSRHRPRRVRVPSLLGMTESFGPVLRRPPRPRPARAARRAAAGGRSPTSRSASSTPTPANESSPAWSGEIQIRGRNLMRGICGRVRSEVFTRGRLLPDRRPRRRSTPTATSSSAVGATTCSRSRARASTRARSRPRSATLPEVEQGVRRRRRATPADDRRSARSSCSVPGRATAPSSSSHRRPGRA